MRPRITFANVVSVIALFVALGGTAIATHPGGQNTISTADIQNGQVKTDDLGNGEVKVADIGQGAVATDELANNQVKAADIGDGEVRAAEVANGQVTADELAANSVRSDEVADGQVRTQEIGNGQVQAQDLAPGVAPGASGARAWGLVGPGGTLLRSKNIAGVTHPTDGVYCVDPGSGINPDASIMVAGEDIDSGFTSDGLDQISHAEWDSSPTSCPVGAMEVKTFVGVGIPGTGAETDIGGFTMFSLDMPFTFVIP